MLHCRLEIDLWVRGDIFLLKEYKGDERGEEMMSWLQSAMDTLMERIDACLDQEQSTEKGPPWCVQNIQSCQSISVASWQRYWTASFREVID